MIPESVLLLRRCAAASMLLVAGCALSAPVYGSTTAATTAGTTPPPAASPRTAAQLQADAYYHAMLAHGYEEQAIAGAQPGLANQAIDEYKAALAADPDSAPLHIALAELYFRTGRAQEAIAVAKAQIAKDPNSLPAHKLLGRIYLRTLGDGQGTARGQTLQLAIAEYTRIVQLEPNSIEDHLLLGQLYSFAKDSVRAQQQFAAAQTIDPHSEEVVLNMARIDTEQNNLQGAVQVLTSLPAGDQTAKTEYALGATYDQLKQLTPAIAAYRKSLALEPDNLDVERALAEALRRDGQNKAALDAYDDVIEGDPTDASAYLRAAEIERAEGRLDNALADLKKATPLATDSLEIAYDEAVIYQKMGRFQDAEQLFTKLAASTASTKEQSPSGDKNNAALFLDHLASVYQAEGRLDDAIATWNRMVPLGGDYALSAWGAEVDAYRGAHQYDKALAVLQQATARFPKNRGLKLALANELATAGRFDDAVTAARSLLTNTPQDRDVYLTLAQIDAHGKKWKDAGEALDKALALSVRSSDKVAVYLERGMFEDRQKHYDAAESDYKQALTLEPNNSLVLNNYGYMLADRGVRLNDALAMLQKANHLDPDNYATLDSLGWAYYRLGQYALAENNLLKASQHAEDDPTVHEHLGDLYEKTDRLKQAAAQWEESLKLFAKTDPTDAEPGEGQRVQKKLDQARVRLARAGSADDVK